MKAVNFKIIHQLAIPATISGISEPLLSLTDTAIVGRIPEQGAAALAAAGAVGAFLSTLIWVLGQTRSALGAVVSQHKGAQNLKSIKTLTGQTLFFNIGLSLLIIVVCLPLAKNILILLNTTGEVLELGTTYLQIRILGMPFTLFCFTLFGVCRGLQDTVSPMIVSLIGTAINIVLDLVLVFGWPGLISPMGLEGAAIASLLAQIIMAACTYYYIRKKHPAITLVLRWPIHPKIKQVLQLMTNLFLRSLTLNLTLLFAVKEAAKYGTISLSAHTIGINLWLFAAFFIDGYGDSANALSGKLLGAKDAKGLLHLNRLILKYAFSLGVILTLIGFIAAPYIGYVFTEEVEVLTQFDKVFPVVLITFPISAIAFVYDGFYKGLGEAAFLRNTLLTASLIGFLPSFYLFDSFGFNLMAVWYAIGVWMIIRALFPYFYFKLYIRRI